MQTALLGLLNHEDFQTAMRAVRMAAVDVACLCLLLLVASGRLPIPRLSPSNHSPLPTTHFLLPYAPGANFRLLGTGIHGDGAWPGRDYIADCGTPLYNPLPNAQVIRSGRDSYEGPYGSGNTFILIANDEYQMMFMHGHYTAPAGPIAQGEQFGVVGDEGNSSECHDHISVKQDGRLVDISQVFPVPDKPLKATWYDPDRGGINCDSDCSNFANGERVTEAHYGNTAACIQGWEGRTVTVEGLGEFTCRDRGGKIVEEGGYIRIDILSHDPIPCPNDECLFQAWRVK